MGQRLGHHTLDHLAFRFQSGQCLATALQQPASAFRKLHSLPKFEGVVVRDHDLGAVQIAQHIAGDQFPAAVISVRIVRLQHSIEGGRESSDLGKPPKTRA